MVASYMKAIKVTVDGPREPRTKTSKLLLFIFIYFTFTCDLREIDATHIYENPVSYLFLERNSIEEI